MEIARPIIKNEKKPVFKVEEENGETPMVKTEDLEAVEQFIDGNQVYDRPTFKEECDIDLTEHAVKIGGIQQKIEGGRISEQQNKIDKNSKNIRCKFCDEDISTRNFTRHIERKHSSESEVIKILDLPKTSKERRNAFILLRNDTNFKLYLQGTTRPYRQTQTEMGQSDLYYPCADCKGLFMRNYLRIHAKRCIVKMQKERKNYCSASQTLTACAMDKTNVISKLNVKQQIFDIMKPDDISFEAKKDLLIVHFGESYLKRHKREKNNNVCSIRMRELSRLLIAFRKVSGQEKCQMKDVVLSKNFGKILTAIKEVAGYDPRRKMFKTPSLALNLGTSLKQVCHELKNLILEESEGFRYGPYVSADDWLDDIENFIGLIESRWTIELSSMANSLDLQDEKRE